MLFIPLKRLFQTPLIAAYNISDMNKNITDYMKKKDTPAKSPSKSPAKPSSQDPNKTD
jgi:hypothetical protein